MSVRKKRMICMVFGIIVCAIAVWFIVQFIQKRDAEEFAKKCKSYVGVWTSDDGQYEMTVRRVTGAHAILSLNNTETTAVLNFVVAHAVSENRYEFTYNLEQNVYTGENSISEGNKEKGSIELLDSSVRVDVPLVEGKARALEFQGVFRKKEALKEEKSHLLENMGTTHTVPKEMEEFCSFDKGSDGKVERVRMIWEKTDENYFYSDMNGINNLCFESDCRALFGKEDSREELENGRRKLVFSDDAYRYAFIINEHDLVVEGDCQYLEPAGRKREGDFLIQDDTLVRYLGDYEKERDVVLPEGIKRIASHAFTEDIINYDHVRLFRLTIPKDVVIEKEAFTGCSRIEVSFEEGRTEIPEGAFAGIVREKDMLSLQYDWAKITLSKSMRRLGNSAFRQEVIENEEETPETYPVSVILNDGLEIIEENSLSGILLTGLPDTLKRIEKGVTLQLSDMKRFRLPSSLEELGNHALQFGAVGVMKELIIPASLRTIGEDVLSAGYLSIEKVTVEKGNRYLKVDDAGWLTSTDGKILYMVPGTVYGITDGNTTGRGKQISETQKRIDVERRETAVDRIMSITVTVPEGVEEIRSDAVKGLLDGVFMGMNVEEDYRVVFPASLKRIDRDSVLSMENLRFRGNAPEFTGMIKEGTTAYMIDGNTISVKRSQVKEFRKKILQGQEHLEKDVTKKIKKIITAY